MTEHAASTKPAIEADFFGLSQSDWGHLPRVAKTIRQHGEKALDRFYAVVARRPDMARFFASPAMIQHAKQKQLQHWGTLFGGAPGPTYYAQAETVGHTHARIGLAPHWYIGAYAQVLGDVIRAAGGGRGIGAGLGSDALATLVRLALLDMSVALSAYFNAEDAARQQVMDKFSAVMSDMASGNFTSQLTGLPREYARLEQDFESMREKIVEALSEVADVSEGIKRGAFEIQQASDDLARRTEGQAASLEETAAALNQVTSGLSDTAGEASSVRQSVQESQSEAEAGGTILTEAIGAMEALQSSSSEIGKIVDVIDGISFQTNLLALNAGVEAARAGEAGKGFAVVANEVRALAQRSADAAQNIKTLIQASGRDVETVATLVRKSGHAFTAIIGRVSDMTGRVTSISEYTASQAQGLAQVNGAVRNMDTVTQQNAAMVEQASAASRSLASEAGRLAQLVSRFRLDGGRSRRGAAEPMSEFEQPRRRYG